MKEIRKEKVGGTGKGRSESSRGLGRSTLVALVAGLARLVRPLVDTVVVTAAVLAPRGVGRTAERLAVLRTVLHRVRPLDGRPGRGSRPMPGVAASGYRPGTTGRAVGVAARERDAHAGSVVAN